MKNNLSSIKSKMQESRSRWRDDIGENTRDVERSELVPPERWRHTTCFLPRAPLARTLGAKESLYIYIYVHIWEDLIIYAAEEKRSHKHKGCLHTCNEHTLVQSTLLQPYTSYTGALTYTTTLHEPTNTKPCTSPQTPTQTYKLLHAYDTYILYIYKTLHTYTTPTYMHYSSTYTTLQPLQHTTSYDLHCKAALPLHTCSMSMWLASEAFIC